MPVNYSFTLPDGTESRPVPSDLTDEQYGFLRLSEMGLGIPLLDRKSLDEFVRRADLIQAYLGRVLNDEKGKPRTLVRADFVKLLPAARTNWSPVRKTDFDRLMKKEIEAYWESVDRKVKES
jgi:hypothetical protein